MIYYGYVKKEIPIKILVGIEQNLRFVGHKYADLSNNDYGVAIMNDCKYGYSILDNTIDQIFRSPNNLMQMQILADIFYL